MMSNNKPWQAIVNADSPKVMTSENNLAVVQKDASSKNEENAFYLKVLTPKRYSFDDNGGGYQGL